MEQLTNYDVFIRKYNLCMNEMLNLNYKKAHRALIASMDAYRKYINESECNDKVIALRFGKSLRALEKQLGEKSGLYTPIKKDTETKQLLSNVAGLNQVKEEVRRLVIYPQTHPELYVRFKKSKGGGILFYGVPGTGKTRIAKEVAREINAHFIEVKCSSVLSKWYGESEKNIKEIFDEARGYDTSIIFFDEFEAIGASRNNEKNEVSTRVVSELLSQIQGFNDCESNVIVIAATNRPWDIDSAFLRPGRFNNLIYIPLPDEEARRMIIEYELEGIQVSSDFNVQEIVCRTKGFNRADVVEFCERLKDQVIERIINESGSDVITNDDVLEVSSKLLSSVKKEDLEQIKKYIKGIRQCNA